MTELLLHNLQLVLAEEIVDGHLSIRDGRIAAIGTGRLRQPCAIDLGGDLLLPGLVELHTDNLERHLQPRPGVHWPPALALAAHDSELLGAGITSACEALSLGYLEPGTEPLPAPLAICQALAEAQTAQTLRVAHYLHLRAELPCADLLEQLPPLLALPALRLLSLTDHTPGQRQYRDLERYRRQYGMPPEAAQAWLQQTRAAQQQHRARNLAGALALASACTPRLRLASHDDTTLADVDEALGYRADICEFPTTLAAAQAAHAAGLCVVAGAPNLLRGHSHSGNVAALELAQAGVLDAISSDYVPGSLLPAISVLQQQAGWGLPQAVRAATLAPARALGLEDRGVLAIGARADLLRVRAGTSLRLVEVWVGGQRRLG